MSGITPRADIRERGIDFAAGESRRDVENAGASTQIEQTAVGYEHGGLPDDVRTLALGVEKPLRAARATICAAV
jgi:hypothetical protein